MKPWSIALPLLLVACGSSGGSVPCTTDSECPLNYRCQRERCRSIEAVDTGVRIDAGQATSDAAPEDDAAADAGAPMVDAGACPDLLGAYQVGEALHDTPCELLLGETISLASTREGSACFVSVTSPSMIMSGSVDAAGVVTISGGIGDSRGPCMGRWLPLDEVLLFQCTLDDVIECEFVATPAG